MMGVRGASRVATLISLAISVFCAHASASPKPTDHPRWAVLVVSDITGRYIDEPICRPLDYFGHPGNPQRFDYDHELSAKKPEEIKETVSIHPVGNVPGHAVWQVVRVINGNELAIKMILVERKQYEYCEIYHQQLAPDLVTAEPAYLLQIGSDVILASTDHWTGNSGQRQDVYWILDKDGPLWLDVDSKVQEALKEFRPKEFIIMGGGGFDIRTLTYGMPLWAPNDPHCCPTGGSIEIKFALQDHKLVVISHSYKKK